MTEIECDPGPSREYVPFIPKEIAKEILKKADDLRFSKETQNEFNKIDHSEWFVTVINNLYISLLRQYGYKDVMSRALDELYSTRWIYRNDPEMNEFFNGLVHVKYDFTGEGHLEHGDDIPDEVLFTLDKTQMSLLHYCEEAKKKNRPLVIFSGSWT
jgi:hypothetical protein